FRSIGEEADAGVFLVAFEDADADAFFGEAGGAGVETHGDLAVAGTVGGGRLDLDRRAVDDALLGRGFVELDAQGVGAGVGVVGVEADLEGRLPTGGGLVGAAVAGAPVGHINGDVLEVVFGEKLGGVGGGGDGGGQHEGGQRSGQ